MFYEDRRIIYILLAIIVVLNVINLGTGGLLNIVLTLPGVLIAITFHEFAHAFVAVKLGDDTPKYQGRLSLNPLSHLDPFGILMLLFVHIGWGKPVEINPRNFNRNISEEKAEAIVSIAGPLMNFILAILFTIISFLIAKFASSFVYTQVGIIVMTIIQYTVIVNIGLGVFNLIPLPPLDGSKILKSFLPYNAKRWFEEKQQLFYFVFLIIWITGIAGNIISPLITAIYNGLNHLIGTLF